MIQNRNGNEETANEVQGLTEAEAARRLAHYGKNTLIKHKKKPAILLFLGQFTDLMIIILIICTAISAFMGDLIEAFVMIGIVVVNAFLGFIQEFRTEKTLEALRNMTAPVATVIRQGKEKNIPSDSIVPGDIVKISAGNRAPADGKILETSGVSVDESMLTGESNAVYKESGMLYSGTVIVGGTATICVTETGMNTEMGKISGMINDANDDETPLQKRLAKLGIVILFACAAVCLIVTGVGVLKGEPLFQMLMSGISLAVAAVPEGLPAIVTISLALCVQKMAVHNALVRRLPAVETLGSTNVICSDKTGTLTMNKMTVKTVLTINDIQKTIRPSELPPISQTKSSTSPDIEKILDIAINCNNGDSATEEALLRLGKAEPQHCDSKKYTRIGEIPFTSSRKYMSTAFSCKDGNYIFSKGAPDVILRKCTHYMKNGKIVPLDVRTKNQITRAIETLAQNALRVIGFAWRPLLTSETVSAKNADTVERKMVFTGLAGLSDPLRPEVPDAVKTCSEAGIRTVMITGDHQITASAIGSELGLVNKDEHVICGDEIEKMTDDELCEAVKKTSVFARVLPIHKLRLVKAFKKNGNIVAMTGDGVNDAPAVKEADIGVAMGKNGTEVTREASSMVLVDDNFATIVTAVRYGRAIYSNIKKFIRYMLACNLGEVVTMFAAILAGLPLPLIPIQILWVNLVTDGLPGIALGLEPEEDNVMKQPPMGSDGGIFTKKMAWLIIFRGILTGLTTLGAFGLVYYSTGSLTTGRTTAFVTLVLVQLVHSFECRSDTKSLFKIGLRGNSFLLMSAAISFILMLAVVYVAPLQQIFSTVALGLSEWITIVLFTAIGPIAGAVGTVGVFDKKKDDISTSHKRCKDSCNSTNETF